MLPNVAADDRLAFATGHRLAHRRIVLPGGGLMAEGEADKEYLPEQNT